ncbi:site-specific integrase [Actinosynnema sp. ALI-1.44]|uniref:site-specific integrase n=1 Tax=Actinosynnema sp. ALI-1.44 TaxID=1933779 RepID=UPI00143DE092|nr:site-specific integrase [Actinosynnema sp. ALI-1.44]
MKKALANRSKSAGSGGLFTGEMKVTLLAEKYFEEFRRLVEEGQRSPTTLDQYEGMWERHLKKAVGDLRCREIDAVNGGVGIMHEILVAIGRTSKSNAKMARSVLSGMCAFGVPRTAMSANPMRDVGSIEVKTKRAKRGMSPAEIIDFHGKLVDHPKAARWDLPDLTTMHAATGVRISESLAVDWENVNWETNQVEFAWRIIRVKGKGLKRVENLKRATGDRIMGLPGFGMAMLKRRWLAAGKPTTGPVFPDRYGGWRDPSNTRRVLREVRALIGYGWVVSHIFRRAVATILDRGGATARQVANQLGHVRVSMTQDNYLEREVANDGNAEIIEGAFGDWDPSTPEGAADGNTAADDNVAERPA